MTPCKYTILIFTICAIICSCNRELDKALSNAGNNRSELVKVLDHFKNDPDPLKYKSAVFIIENMPYHGTRYAQNADTFSAIYRNMAESALELRDSVLKRRIVTDMQSEQFIPALFKNPDFIYEKYFL